MESIKSLSTKRKIGGVIAIALLIACAATPLFWTNETTISVAGMRTVFLLLAYLIMLIFEVLPIVVISLLFIGLMPTLGVVDGLASALVGYTNPVVFFTLASFGIAAALINVPLSDRILGAMLRAFGNSIERVILALMICCAVISSMVSNVPCCAVFMALSLNFLNLYDNEKDKRQTGRAFLIAIPVASMIGGMMTPVGSSVNLIALQQLENAGYSSVGFVQWMCFAVPMAVILLPIAWLLICKVFKPVQVTKNQINGFVDSMNIPKKVGTQEIKVIVVIATMFVLWISSSWITSINTMVVAIIGCVVFFLPGISVLDVDTFLKQNSWDAFFLVGSVISISTAMTTNGIGDVMANFISGLLPSEISAVFMVALCAIIIFVCLVINPVATSLIPLILPVLITVAIGAGVSPVLITMTAAICACNCYLLPLDTVPLITYSKGYYAMTDMMKCTIWLQILLVILCSLWLPVIAGVFGFVV